MNKTTISSLLLGAALATLAVCVLDAQAQGSASRATRVGFVNSERILREAVPAKLARARMEADFAGRQKELDLAAQRNQAVSDAYQRDAPTLSETERSRRQLEVINQERYLQRLQRTFNEDVNTRRTQELSALQDTANRAVRKIAMAGGYDLVIQEATYVNPRVDLTDEVLHELALEVH